jgi:hypothetical protein
VTFSQAFRVYFIFIYFLKGADSTGIAQEKMFVILMSYFVTFSVPLAHAVDIKYGIAKRTGSVVAHDCY